MKINKTLRHKIYVSALEHYKKSIDGYKHNYKPLRGICYSLANNSFISSLPDKKQEVYCDYCEHDELFPEIFNHKPINCNSSYWFMLTDTESRIKILENAIELTKRKSKSKII